MIVVLTPNRSGKRAAGIAMALADFGTRPTVVGPARRPAGRWDDFAERAAATFAPDVWVVAAGSLPKGAPLYGIAGLIETAHARDASTFVDLRGEVLGSALVAGPDVVSISMREAGTALGRDMGHPDDAVWAATEFLRGAGARTRVVVVRGMGGLAFAVRDAAPGGAPATGSRTFGRNSDPARLDAALVWAFHRSNGRVSDLGVIEQVARAAAGRRGTG